MGSLFDGSVGDAGFFSNTQSRHDVHDVLVIVMQCVHHASTRSRSMCVPLWLHYRPPDGSRQDQEPVAIC